MRICEIEWCNEKHDAKGYCSRHYKQMKRHGKILNRTIYDPNEIIIIGDIAEIVLYDINNKEKARAIIDVDDIGKIKKYKWCLRGNYVVTNYLEGFLCLHHIIGGDPKNKFSDHKDRNPLNNRKNNLRLASQSQNLMNRPMQSNNKSGFKGVHWSNRSKRWISKIKANCKEIYIGSFIEKIDAAIAYNKAALKYHGEFAYINKIERINNAKI